MEKDGRYTLYAKFELTLKLERRHHPCTTRINKKELDRRNSLQRTVRKECVTITIFLSYTVCSVEDRPFAHSHTLDAWRLCPVTYSICFLTFRRCCRLHTNSTLHTHQLVKASSPPGHAAAVVPPHRWPATYQRTPFQHPS